MNETAFNKSTEAILVNKLIQSRYIIDYGTIAEFLDDEEIHQIARVQIGACMNEGDYITFPCYLCTTCSANMTVKIEPKIGDKVIVLYPRRFSASMLDPENKDTSVYLENEGYSFGRGLAFYAAQFFEDEEVLKNVLHINDTDIIFNSDKKLTAKVKDTTVSIDEEGNIVVSSADSKAITINGAKFTVKNGEVDISASKVTINGTSLEVV